jgi:hypothetical protein
MGIKVETRPDENLMIIRLQAPLSLPEDPMEATEATVKFQQEQDGVICRITDYTKVKLTFSDVVEGMASDKVFRNPNIISVMVGSDAMVKMAADSFKQEQYGAVDVILVSTMDEALEKGKQMLQKKQKAR